MAASFTHLHRRYIWANVKIIYTCIIIYVCKTKIQAEKLDPGKWLWDRFLCSDYLCTCLKDTCWMKYRSMSLLSTFVSASGISMFSSTAAPFVAVPPLVGSSTQTDIVIHPTSVLSACLPQTHHLLTRVITSHIDVSSLDMPWLFMAT